jgi:hypothetical protein
MRILQTKLRLLFLALPPLFVTGFLGAQTAPATEKQWVKAQLDFALQQYKYLAQEVGARNAGLPKSLSDDGSLVLVPPKDWTSGFFAGGLWYLYDYSKDEAILQEAVKYTEQLNTVLQGPYDHDIGFIMMSSFGHAFRLIPREAYKMQLLQAAEALASRFNQKVACTRSWDWGPWKFPVIIDNLMNMELLYWAAAAGGSAQWQDIANQHNNTTMKNHFRPNGSSYHLVDYDPKTAQVLRMQTVQGYADESSWSRGQGWALYGYTMAYRFTRNPEFLNQALRVANFILSQHILRSEPVPPWDFDVPDQAASLKDSSAGAIYASAFQELAEYVDKEQATGFLNYADRLLESLSSERFRASTKGALHGFLLDHAVGWYTGGSDLDKPLIYGDYYYIEAMVRKLQRLEQAESDRKPGS